MEIDDALFDKIAHLARLNFSEEEREAMKADMTKIVSWVEKLDELSFEDEPLLGMSPAVNATREDIPQEGLNREIALKNAPDSNNEFIKVPKVID